jgi:hypothetical protein
MTHPTRIALCGDSLLLAGLEADLRRTAGLQVLHLAAPILLQSEARPPEVGVVVYDQAATELRQFAGWLTDCPDLILLDLDAEHDRVHVVAGHSRPVLTIGDLARLVQQAAANSLAI